MAQQHRLERLMNVIALLSTTRRALTLREIVATVPGYPDSFSSARRAFERDKEELRGMNFEIVVTDTPEGDSGYRIDNASTYFDVSLTAQQRNIVDYALAVYGSREETSATAMAKLGGMNPENSLDDVIALPVPETLAEIFSASLNKQSVTIHFKNEHRHIVPRAIVARAGYWYVKAWDLDKERSRTFRIDRISEVAVRGAAPDFPEEAGHEVSDDSLSIDVRVHPLLREQFLQEWLGSYDSVNDTVRINVSGTELFLSRLWEYSGFVSVVGPEELVDEINNIFDRTLVSLEDHHG